MITVADCKGRSPPSHPCPGKESQTHALKKKKNQKPHQNLQKIIFLVTRSDVRNKDHSLALTLDSIDKKPHTVSDFFLPLLHSTAQMSGYRCMPTWDKNNQFKQKEKERSLRQRESPCLYHPGRDAVGWCWPVRPERSTFLLYVLLFPTCCRSGAAAARSRLSVSLHTHTRTHIHTHTHTCTHTHTHTHMRAHAHTHTHMQH